MAPVHFAPTRNRKETTMELGRTDSERRIYGHIIGCFITIALAIAIVTYSVITAPDPVPEPTRAPAPVETQKTPEPTNTKSAPAPVAKETPEPLQIAPSDILSMAIPAVELNALVSGETLPRASKNCKGGAELCIDPPVPDQAAWYGTVPALQSEGTVRLFGHTSWEYAEYATFNALIAMEDGDEIVVKTETGIFTYKASAPQLVPYGEVVNSQLIWGNEPDRLVLVTCNNKEASGTVVEAWLVSAEPLQAIDS